MLRNDKPSEESREQLMDVKPPKLQTVKALTFDKQVVMLDGMRFENCVFNECTIRYTGGPAQLHSCTISPNTVWDFRAHAAQVIQVLQEAGFRLEYGKSGKDSEAISPKDNPTVQ
jgi:hypothetical protein